MALAFTHLVPAWISGKLFEKFSVKLKHPELALLLLGSILPDADLLIEWTTGVYVHRFFTHSLAFLMLSGLLVYIISKVVKNKDIRPQVGALALMLGVTTHLVLDMIDLAGIQLLWPMAARISFFGVGPLIPLFFPVSQATISLFIFDAGLGVAWMFYLIVRRRLFP